jgi:hypothetical protein
MALAAAAGSHADNREKCPFSVMTVTAEPRNIRYMWIMKREATPMTIRLHLTQQIVERLISAMSRHHRSVPAGMDRRFLADIGLSQSDLLALQVR